MTTQANSATPQPAPVGREGVMLFEGSQIQLERLEISVGPDGRLTGGPVQFKLSWEIWPMWMRVAIEHEAAAEAARDALLHAHGDGDDALRAELLSEEARAGMVTIAATAFAYEAIALSASLKAGLPAEIGAGSSTANRVGEIMFRCFAIPTGQVTAWRAGLRQLFDIRNEAVHPDAGFHEPYSHPALRALVARPAHVYRLENAKNVVDGALGSFQSFAKIPRTTRGKSFKEAIAPWGKLADDLAAQRSRLRPAEGGPANASRGGAKS